MPSLAWLRRLRRPTRRMILTRGDAGALPRTKLGGVPWWPSGLPRPVCAKGHAMAFVAQVRIDDGKLVSLHHCQTCASFGWRDRTNRAYDVAILNPRQGKPDALGIVAESPVPAYRVALSRSVLEVPELEEIPTARWDGLPEMTAQDDFDEHVYPGLIHVPRCKVGGWPSWCQHPEWPKCRASGRMGFVAQIDAAVVESGALWAGGGYAYLFICPPRCPRRHGECSILTT